MSSFTRLAVVEVDRQGEAAVEHLPEEVAEHYLMEEVVEYLSSRQHRIAVGT